VPEPAAPAAAAAPPLAPRTAFGRPLHVSRLTWYGGTFLVFLAVVVMVALSTWQYSRAKPHTDAATLAAAQARPAVPAPQVLHAGSELSASMVGRKVVVSGHYLPGKQGLVERTRDGTTGWLVVTGFVPAGRDLPGSMLVVRGWSASTQVPPAPAGPQRLTAWIAPPEPVSGTLTSSAHADRLPELAPARVTDQLPAPLLNGYLGVVHPSAPLQSVHEPNPVSKSGWSLLNLGYSVQWLLFAGGAMVMWMLQVRDARREPGQPVEPTARATGSGADPQRQAAGAGSS